MFLCSGQQPAIHHLAQCWSGSDHSTTPFPRRTDTSTGSSIATGLPIMGNHMSGAIRRMVATGRICKPHSQGTTSVLGHKRRCSVEHVLRMREGGFVGVSFVAMVLHVGRQSRVPFGGSPAAAAAPPNPFPVSEGWAQLDTVDLQEELLTRVPMLKSCPHCFHCLAVATIDTRPTVGGTVPLAKSSLAENINWNNS